MIIWIVQDGSYPDVGQVYSAWDNVDDAIEAAAQLCAEVDDWREQLSWYRDEYKSITKEGLFTATDCFGYFTITQMHLGGH